MQIKGIKDEDFANYRLPSMFIIFPKCSFKCDKENGFVLCQNYHLAREPLMQTTAIKIIERYEENQLTKAIVCGGLEPFDTASELLDLVYTAREIRHINDDIVIYTGYTEEELQENWFFKNIIKYPNIVIKFGRYRPKQDPHYDDVLGVLLASDNQYAKRYN